VVATLGTLAEEVEKQHVGAPAITVVGEVVNLRQELNWFETRPLFGQTMLVTRTRHQSGELRQRLEAAGAEVLEAPTIRLEKPADDTPVRQALHRLAEGGYDWTIFTSANGVAATKKAMAAANLDSRLFAGTKIAAVGPKTADAVQEHLALIPDLLPARPDGRGLAEAIGNAGRRFLLLRADIGGQGIVNDLAAHGHVDDVAVYETKPVDALPDDVTAALTAGGVDWAVFTSSSTARNLLALTGIDGVKTASIGPQTSATLRELGVEPAVEAIEPAVAAVVEAVIGSVTGSTGRRQG
jgi:uroporphyrinogen III methyltransferase/synthase